MFTVMTTFSISKCLLGLSSFLKNESLNGLPREVMEPPSLEMFKERLTVANHCCGPVDGGAQSLALKISVRMERTSDSVKKFHKIPPFQWLSTSQRRTKATQVPPCYH